MQKRNVRIPINQNDTNLVFDLEQDFDSLDVLTLKLTSSEAYSKANSDFGVVVGRAVINGGFGVKNAKVSVFVPILNEDKVRPEILALYPFETINDLFPNGVRYNLLPRVKQKNPDHVPVGTFPDISDLTHYPAYVEVLEKYYKYTTTTNDSGDYMIFGVPLGAQNVMIDFDLLDTPTLTIGVRDLIYSLPFGKELLTTDQDKPDPNRVSGFIYYGNQTYAVAPNTDLDAMPNIFSQKKSINVIPFWGDRTKVQLGITRCDFNINYDYVPTAAFFGTMMCGVPGTFVINENYGVSANSNTDDLNTFRNLQIVVWKEAIVDGVSTREYFGTFDAISAKKSLEFETKYPNSINADMYGVYSLNLPMYDNFYITNEFGQVVPSTDGTGIPTTGSYAFEFYEADQHWSGRLSPTNDYSRVLLPGVRVPSKLDGNKTLGGWVGFQKFDYDVRNAKRKYYTIATTYITRDKTSVLYDGNRFSWLPNQELSTTSNLLESGFPLLNNVDYSANSDKTVIGSVIIPRVSMVGTVSINADPDNSAYKEDLTNYTVNIKLPENSVSYLKSVSSNLTTNIGPQEWILGFNVKPNGVRNGQPMTKFGDEDKQIPYYNNGYYKILYETNTETTTWNYGPNGYNGIINPIGQALFYTNIQKNMFVADQLNSENVFNMYTTGTLSKEATSGIFINSSNQGGGTGLFTISVYDITDELSNLIKDSVNSSNRYTDQKYNNKRYYFGTTYDKSSLKAIANIYHE